VTNLAKESAATRTAYGLDEAKTKDWGTRCLVARRLVESGVRFIHILSPEVQWDHHSQLKQRLESDTAAVDQPIGALLADLKQRGLLKDTLVVIASEMGRTPTGENNGGLNGRGHNNQGFSFILAGGGMKRGHIHGATDEFGVQAVENPVTIFDFQATVLHALGLDWEKLQYPYAGRDESLIGVNTATVVKEFFA
jgi:uncharacterized protein (DUF1501 family)